MMYDSWHRTLLYLALLFFLLSICPTVQGLTFYEELELEKGEDSTEKDIKKQFRVLSKKYHPDINPSEGARERYQRIQRAHEVLSDRRKKKMYDLRGEEGLKQLEAAAQGGGAVDPFAAFFGGGAQGMQREQVSMNVDVSLEDIYLGRTLNISFKKQKLCRHCKGSGAASKDAFTTCTVCKGSGKVLARMQFGPFVQTVEQQCSNCAGKGKQVKHVCPVCRGNKIHSQTHTLEVEVERGIPEGHEVIYEMEGDEHPDKIPPDLKLNFRSRKHSKFTRVGNDLHTTIQITLLESLIGFEHVMSHFDHEVVISRDEITPSGTVLTILGEGMPIFNIPSERGNLLVKVDVRFPAVIPQDRREALRYVLSNMEDEKHSS